jgi:hypothetical protein
LKDKTGKRWKSYRKLKIIMNYSVVDNQSINGSNADKLAGQAFRQTFAGVLIFLHAIGVYFFTAGGWLRQGGSGWGRISCRSQYKKAGHQAKGDTAKKYPVLFLHDVGF